MLPAIVTVNPMAKRRRHRAHSAHRRHHRRHTNTFRRRHKVRAHNAFRRRHRHRRSNPFSLRGAMGEFTPALYGAAGGVGLDIALAYIPLPAALQSGYANSAVRIAGAIGLGALAGMAFGRRTGALVGAGALTVQLYSILRGIAQSTIGASVKGLSGLADFKDYSLAGPGMGAYMRPRIGAYMRGGMGAYMNPGTVVSGLAGRGLASRGVAGLRGYGGLGGPGTAWSRGHVAESAD